jgi:hypothetical protein
VEGTFTTGRPPEVRPATSQHVVMGFPMLPIKVPQEGVYFVVGSINGVECKTTEFTAVAGKPSPKAVP